MAEGDQERNDPLDGGPKDSELNAKLDPDLPGAWATFARNALHDATCGWDERVAALSQSAFFELRQLGDVMNGRKSLRQAGEEARQRTREALASAQQSREAGNRAHPVAALTGGLVPQIALGIMSGGLLATPLAQAAMAASKSLAESPEDLTTIEGLKTAVPRAGFAAGTAAALMKGGQLVQRAVSPLTEHLGAKTLRPLLAEIQSITRGGKELMPFCEVGRELLNRAYERSRRSRSV